MVKEMKKRSPISSPTSTVAMDEFLKTQNLYRKPIAKDGSCLFRAVAEQVFSSQAKHMQVRLDCIEYLRKHKENFKEFVEGPFDHHLYNLRNPKEWAGQVEISALSHMYKRDFVVYQDVSRPPTQVTNNSYDQKILLCFSNGNHYDSVYSATYPKSAAMCQSLVYNLLYEKVFPLVEQKENAKKAAMPVKKPPTQGTLPDQGKVNGEVHADDDIGGTDDGWTEVKSRSKAKGRQFKASDVQVEQPEQREEPIQDNKSQWEIIRSLDPQSYRNVELEIWEQNRSEQQNTDLSLATHIQFQENDRVIVRSLPQVNNRQYAGLIHQVYKDSCMVYIPGLRQKYSVPISNIKLDPNANDSPGYRDLSGFYKKPEETNTSPEGSNANSMGSKDDPKKRRKPNRKGGGGRPMKPGEVDAEELNQYNRSLTDEPGQRRKFGRRPPPRPRRDERPPQRNPEGEDMRLFEELQEKDPAAFPALPTQSTEDKGNAEQSPFAFWSQYKNKPQMPNQKPGKTEVDNVASGGVEEKHIPEETTGNFGETKSLENRDDKPPTRSQSAFVKTSLSDNAMNGLTHGFESLNVNKEEMNDFSSPSVNMEGASAEYADTWTKEDFTPEEKPFTLETDLNTNAEDGKLLSSDTCELSKSSSNGTRVHFNDMFNDMESLDKKDNVDEATKSEEILDDYVQNPGLDLTEETLETSPRQTAETTEKVKEDNLESAQTMEKEPCTQKEFSSGLNIESKIFHVNKAQNSNHQDNGMNTSGTNANQTIENTSRSVPSAILTKPAPEIKHSEPTPEYTGSDTTSQSSIVVTQSTTPESASISQPTPTQTPSLTQPVSWGEQFQPQVNQGQGGIWPTGIPNIPSGPSLDSNGQDLPKDVKTLQFFYNLGWHYYMSTHSQVQLVYPSYYPSLPEHMHPPSQHMSVYHNPHIQTTALSGGSAGPENSPVVDRTSSGERVTMSYPYSMTTPFNSHQPFMMSQPVPSWQPHHHSPGQMHHGMHTPEHYPSKNMDQHQNHSIYNSNPHPQHQYHHSNNQHRHQNTHKNQGNKKFSSKGSGRYQHQTWSQQVSGSNATHFDMAHNYHPISASQGGGIPAAAGHIQGMEYADRMGMPYSYPGNQGHAGHSHGTPNSLGGYQN